MKKTILATLLLGAVAMTMSQAKTLPWGESNQANESSFALQKPSNSYAVIEFDTVRVNLGKFSSKTPERKCTFNFTNTGTAPLVIHQALASCGCTVPNYSKSPVKPGEKGKIDVTYNGKGKFPGHFQKTITIRSNATNEVVRLVVEGDMTEN